MAQENINTVADLIDRLQQLPLDTKLESFSFIFRADPALPPLEKARLISEKDVDRPPEILIHMHAGAAEE